jgi:hypothetical protein
MPACMVCAAASKSAGVGKFLIRIKAAGSMETLSQATVMT